LTGRRFDYTPNPYYPFIKGKGLTHPLNFLILTKLFVKKSVPKTVMKKSGSDSKTALFRVDGPCIQVYPVMEVTTAVGILVVPMGPGT